MGMWGFGLYQNDMALDIQGEFEEMFKNGKSPQEITDALMEEYSSAIGDAEEEPLFWYGLADTQWNLGVLLPRIREKALCWIDMDGGLFKNQIEDAVSEARRKKTLYDLQVKLRSPQPPIKKYGKKRIYRCQWNIGDVFAYKLESELAKEKGLYGRYFLIQKVDEGTWDPGHIVPIVYVKITRDDQLPASVEEYDRLEYVQVGFAKYEERFWPIDMSRPQEDIAEKSKIDYKVDEYGLLPKYRITLLNTSKRAIPSKLIYIGNYQNVIRPTNEFIPHSKVNITVISWKQFEETFETTMIKRYCWHNLRELSIYANKRM